MRLVLALALVTLAGCPAPDIDVNGGCDVRPRCRRNTLVSCGPDGGVAEIPCGEERCAADAPEPLCVPADALPCTPGTLADECLDGRLVTCLETAGYRLTVPCESGWVCAGDRCQRAGDLRCVANLWSPLCVEGQRFVCASGKVQVADAGCPE